MNTIGQIPYLTPQLLLAEGSALLPAIAKLVPQYTWAVMIFASLKAPQFEVDALQVICDKINHFTGATPPAVPS